MLVRTRSIAPSGSSASSWVRVRGRVSEPYNPNPNLALTLALALTLTWLHISGIEEPMSRPYAPVSSEVSHTWW